MATNYYDVLNVPKDADTKTISDAYKKMALKWHPDKNPDKYEEANRQFQQISQAYQVLSDSAKRSRYDRSNDYDSDDDDDDEYDEFESFFDFVSAEMLFRHFFQQSFEHTSRVFNAHSFYNDQQHQQRDNRRRDRNRKAEKVGRHNDNSHEEVSTRTVNGKQWMTKTYFKDGNHIVARYEDGELISEQINGIQQRIPK